MGDAWAANTPREHAAASVDVWAPLDRQHLWIHLHFRRSDSGYVECLSFLKIRYISQTEKKKITLQNNGNKSIQGDIFRVYIGNLFHFKLFF